MISMTIASMEDAEDMAPRMRACDALEVVTAGGLSPLESLQGSIALSKGATWTLWHDGKIMGIWGVADYSVLTGTGIVWLLTTGLVETHSKDFYKVSRSVVEMLREHYTLLINYVDARHEKALRWAKRIGFNVAETPIPFGVSRAPFYRIELTGDRHV